MADQSQVEVKLKLVVSPDGVRAVDQLTGAVRKTVAAEDELARKIRDRNRMLASLTDRAGLGGGVGGGGGRGVGHTPGGGVFGGINGAVDALGARFGLSSRAMTVGGGALAAAHVVREGVSAQTRADQIAANPWLTAAQKEEAVARSRPFGVGKAFGESLDFYRGVTGREARFQAAAQRQQIGMLRAEFQGRQDDVRFGVGFAESSQQIRAQTFAGLRFQRPAGHDRGTVLGRKLFEEEQALLPLIRQRQVAQKERLASERIAGKAAEEEARLRKQLKEIDDQLLKDRKQRGEINAPGSASRRSDNTREDLANVYAREAPLRARREQTADQLAAAQQRTAAARREAQMKGYQEGKARVAQTKQEAEILSGREQTARGQARNLGAMGLEGRMRSQFALQLVQQMGIDAAPPELMQDAAMAFPETVAKMQEQAGAKFLPEFARLAPGEYRDTDIQDISRRADAARESATKTEEKGIADVERGMADALKGLADRLVKGLESSFLSALDGLRMRMEQDGYTRNHGGGG